MAKYTTNYIQIKYLHAVCMSSFNTNHASLPLKQVKKCHMFHVLQKKFALYFIRTKLRRIFVWLSDGASTACSSTAGSFKFSIKLYLTTRDIIPVIFNRSIHIIYIILCTIYSIYFIFNFPIYNC